MKYSEIVGHEITILFQLLQIIKNKIKMTIDINDKWHLALVFRKIFADQP